MQLTRAEKEKQCREARAVWWGGRLDRCSRAPDPAQHDHDALL